MECPPDLPIQCLLLGPELPAVMPDLPLDHKALDGRLRAGHAPAAGVRGAGRWRGVTYQVIRAVREVTLARVKLSGEVGGSGGGVCGGFDGGCGCGCDCGCGCGGGGYDGGVDCGGCCGGTVNSGL